MLDFKLCLQMQAFVSVAIENMTTSSHVVTLNYFIVHTKPFCDMLSWLMAIWMMTIFSDEPYTVSERWDLKQETKVLYRRCHGKHYRLCFTLLCVYIFHVLLLSSQSRHLVQVNRVFLCSQTLPGFHKVGFNTDIFMMFYSKNIHYCLNCRWIVLLMFVRTWEIAWI